MVFIPLLQIFSACIPEIHATLRSKVTDSNGSPVSDVQVEILDLDMNSFSTTQSSNSGEFTSSLPPLQTFFAVLSHPDYMTTSHTGYAGEGDSYIETTLFIEEWDQFSIRKEEYTDCAEGGGYIEGEVRIAIPDQNVDDLPIVRTARAIAFDLNLESTSACYIDPDSELPQTGDSGRFLISNLSEGIHEVMLSIQYDAQTQKEFYYLVFVPNLGFAPLLPTLIPL